MKKIIRATTIPLSLNVFCKGTLKELSKEYEIVAISSPGYLLDEVANREGVRTIPVSMERQISLLKDIRSLYSLIRVFRMERPDMVHSMTPKAGFLCMVAAWWTKVPLRVHTFTGLVFPSKKGVKHMILKEADRLTCACATHIIPEGEGVKNDLLKFNITRKPLKVLGFGNVRGVDMDYYKITPEVLEKAKVIRDGVSFAFLFVGRIVKDKGIDELVSAFKCLIHKYPNIRLFLVGPFEDELDPIGKKTKELLSSCRDIEPVGIKKGIDLLAYYAASDCFVLPSYREGFPNTVLEAGAMGLPSIVTDINGSREIIIDGYNGCIIPPHDENRLYEAMKLMLNDKAKREEMASVCRSHIASHYEQNYVRGCLFDFYREIL